MLVRRKMLIVFCVYAQNAQLINIIIEFINKVVNVNKMKIEKKKQQIFSVTFLNFPN